MVRSGGVKIVGFWITFLLLHFAYDWWPAFPLNLFSAVDESLFQHLKIGFFTYLLVNTLEYGWRRPRRDAWLYSRLWGAILTPWLMFILWYIGPAYYGPFPAIWQDILYANLVLLLLAACLIMIERQLETLLYPRPFKILTVGLFLILLSLFWIFTFRLPWTDLFVEPAGS